MQTCFLSAKQGNFSADLNVIAISSLFDKSREGRNKSGIKMTLVNIVTPLREISTSIEKL